MSNHPMQPLVRDDHGEPRFKRNAIVRYLLDHGGIDLNDLGELNFSDEDRRQFAQLIGYSLDGYGELYYVDDASYSAAETMLATGVTEEQARIETLSTQLQDLRDSLREPAARLFGVHPDDLKKNG